MDGGPSRAKQMKEQHIYEEASLVPLSILQQGKKPQNKNPHHKQTSDALREEEYAVPSIIHEGNVRSGQPAYSYRRNELLGTGGFAKVYKVTDLVTGAVYADKIISTEIFKRRATAKEKVEREINIHRKLDHPNIVIFHKYFRDRGYIHMILEICHNRTLLHVLKHRKTITEPEGRYYLKQIMEGTRYLHLQKVLHRDLKLGNMFLHRDMTLKIGDFGLATIFRHNKPGSMCGTPNYIAPEVLSKKGHGEASDIWAIGCMLFAMLCGHPPFETESLNSTYKKIAKGEFTYPANPYVSEFGRDMIEMMLSPDPEMRGHLGMPNRIQDEMEDLFSHDYLREFTPSTLPSSATRTPPDLELERNSLENMTRSQAVTIDGRRYTNEDPPGCGSFSPIFSPSAPLGSTLKQKFGSFFDKKQKFIQRALYAALTCLEQEEMMTEDHLIKHTILPVFVSKWVDYSNKFGFGFKLANNDVGLQFNDSTRIGCTGNRDFVEFIDLKGKAFTFRARGPVPYGGQDLKVRVEILGSVISYMENNLHDSGSPILGMTTVGPSQKTLIPQLKRWNRRPNAVSLVLNNHTVQVNCLDRHTKIVLFETGGEMFITLIEKEAVRTFSASSIIEKGCPSYLCDWLRFALPELRFFADLE